MVLVLIQQNIQRENNLRRKHSTHVLFVYVCAPNIFKFAEENQEGNRNNISVHRNWLPKFFPFMFIPILSIQPSGQQVSILYLLYMFPKYIHIYICAHIYIYHMPLLTYRSDLLYPYPISSIDRKHPASSRKATVLGVKLSSISLINPVHPIHPVLSTSPIRSVLCWRRIYNIINLHIFQIHIKSGLSVLSIHPFYLSC